MRIRIYLICFVSQLVKMQRFCIVATTCVKTHSFCRFFFSLHFLLRENNSWFFCCYSLCGDINFMYIISLSLVAWMGFLLQRYFASLIFHLYFRNQKQKTKKGKQSQCWDCRHVKNNTNTFVMHQIVHVIQFVVDTKWDARKRMNPLEAILHDEINLSEKFRSLISRSFKINYKLAQLNRNASDLFVGG